MSSRTSQAALYGLSKAEFIVASARTQKPRVTAEVQELFREVVPAGEGPEPDWDVFQESLAFLLEKETERIRQIDHHHRLKLVEASRLRQRRQDKLTDLKSLHRDNRNLFAGTYEDNTLAIVGLDAPPARTLLAVREQLREFLERIEDPELPTRLPDPKKGKSHVSLNDLVTVAKAEALEYEQLMVEIPRLRKELDESLLLKREAIRRHRRLYSSVARILFGLYHLVGLKDLADRIRAADRAPRKKAEAKNEETPSKKAQSGGSDSEPASSTVPQDAGAPTLGPAGRVAETEVDADRDPRTP